MNDLKKVKATCCEGEGQGSCKRCVDMESNVDEFSIQNRRTWRLLLCKMCRWNNGGNEMRFFKVEEIDEDTFTKQAGSYESIFVSGSQRGKDRAVYAFVDETEDEFEIYLDEFAEEE